MGYTCLCGSDIGYSGHYCEAMKKRADARIIEMLEIIAQCALQETGARHGVEYETPEIQRFDIEDNIA